MKNQQKLIIRALSGETTAQVPIWLMRQAGRYLPEYKTLRQKAGSFLNLCFTPEWAAEVTLQPLRRFDLDAAILFSDILVIPYALGQKLDFVEGEGPRLESCDFTKLDFIHFEEKLLPVYETVARLKKELPADKALIGFAGAPWTVACYMIQGRGDGEFLAAKDFAFQDERRFDELMSVIAGVTAQYLLSQIKHGADVVQIFDSWAGLLPEAHFDRWIIAPTRQIVNIIRKEHPSFPIIGFPREAHGLYNSYARNTGISGISLDPQADFSDVPENICIQGNLDPQALLAGGDILKKQAEAVLKSARKRPFIFNLGHGVIKETPPQHVADLVRLVKEFKR